MKIPEQNHSHDCAKVAIFSEKEIVGAFADSINFTNTFFLRESVTIFFGNKINLRESGSTFFTNIPFGETSENGTAKSTLYIRSVFDCVFKNMRQGYVPLKPTFKNMEQGIVPFAGNYKGTLQGRVPWWQNFKITCTRPNPYGRNFAGMTIGIEPVTRNYAGKRLENRTKINK